jgi:hypothetical protein
MSYQLNLFPRAPQRYPERPGWKEGTTSRAAADAIAPECSALQAEVLAAIRKASPRGLTSDEAAAQVGRSILAIRPRVTELYQLGLIEPTGEIRHNAGSHRGAKVYRVTRQRPPT